MYLSVWGDVGLGICLSGVIWAWVRIRDDVGLVISPCGVTLACVSICLGLLGPGCLWVTCGPAFLFGYIGAYL